MNRRTVQAVALAAVILLLVVGEVSGQGGTEVKWWVLSGGGGPSSGGTVTLNDTLGQPVIGAATGETVGLNAGYWVRCVAAAAAAPAVTLARSGADAVLTWPADPNSVRYQVFVSTDPYFDPAGVTPVVTTSPAHTDEGAAASLENHFYIVRGLNACGTASANSGRKGEFTYGLTPGN